VFQGNEEFTALAAALGPRVTLHGMRSGHQSLTYSADTIALLAETYADEIMALPQDRPVALGGNCQGAVIARATAFALRQRGRDPSRLILMEMAKPWAYDAPVDLIYGQDSTLNPYRKDGDPSAVFAAAFPQGFTSHFITGTHGAFFQPPNVTSLASVLRGLLFPGDIP
jgi:thioesterase domain-containing protein